MKRQLQGGERGGASDSQEVSLWKQEVAVHKQEITLHQREVAVHK